MNRLTKWLVKRVLNNFIYYETNIANIDLKANKGWYKEGHISEWEYYKTYWQLRGKISMLEELKKLV